MSGHCVWVAFPLMFHTSIWCMQNFVCKHFTKMVVSRIFTDIRDEKSALLISIHVFYSVISFKSTRSNEQKFTRDIETVYGKDAKKTPLNLCIVKGNRFEIYWMRINLDLPEHGHQTWFNQPLEWHLEQIFSDVVVVVVILSLFQLPRVQSFL